MQETDDLFFEAFFHDILQTYNSGAGIR
ncbi:uncharacterized protein METZ01_LOCUS437918, partial [marine metagenome]